MVHHDGCISIGFDLAYGIGSTKGVAKLGLGVYVGWKYEDCSKWTEVPGGYTVTMSVYEWDDP